MRNTPKPPLAFHPKTPSQWREETIDDCTWYAGAWATAYATNGRCWREPIEIRRVADPDLSGPTKLSLVLTTVDKLWPGQVDTLQSPAYPLTIDEACVRLAMGGAMVVLGHDADFPRYYRRWTNSDDFDHAVACALFVPGIKINKGSRGATWMYDPLGGGRTFQPYDGEWIAVEDLFTKFAWSTGDAVSLAIFAAASEDPVISVPANMPTPRTIAIKAGTKALASPNSAAAVKRTYKNAQTVRYLGTIGAAWHAIVDDLPDAKADKVLYVHQSQVGVVTAVPPILTDPELQARVEALATDLAIKEKELTDQAKALEAANLKLAQIAKLAA